MDKYIYRMSSAGYCPKRLSLVRLGREGTEAPSWLETAAEEGRWHEQRIKQQLLNDGWQVSEDQQELVIEGKLFDLVGHIDGVVSNSHGTYLLEVKSMSHFEFQRWMKGRFEEYPNYADQLTCYLKASGLAEALYIVKNRSSGYVQQWFIDAPPSDFDNIYQKLYGVELAAQAGEIIEAEYNDASIECRRCEYKAMCIPIPEVLDNATEAELVAAALMWKKGKTLVDEGTLLMNDGKAVLEGHALKKSPDKKYSYPVTDLVRVSRYFVPAKHVEFDRKESWQCRVTSVGDSDDE